MKNKSQQPVEEIADADTEKFDVAIEMLEWSIKAFFSGSGYYAAIHLAGAAEEVLSVYLRSPDYELTPAADSFTALFLHLSEPKSRQETKKLKDWLFERMNDARNSVKHKRGHGDGLVAFNAEVEAVDIIERAIENYSLLASKLPLRDVPSILDFRSWVWEKSKSNVG